MDRTMVLGEIRIRPTLSIPYEAQTSFQEIDPQAQ